jgi:hypothetical protein
LGVELLRERVSELSLHAENVLNTEYEHGGTYGVDIPGLGRTVFMRFKQEL